jgi:hypothetical protein
MTLDVPAGPWLLVVGMHRSGTSALTGALGAMGFQTPATADLLEWQESNAAHWESRALTLFDDDLLASLGGSWEAPPPVPPESVKQAAESLVPTPAVAASAAYSEPGPIVWKDPRLCLLLPFWRRVLPGPLAAILVWRSPLAVAHSLRERDGMELADGIALWERYNGSALRNLEGVDAYVCRYEDMTANPGQRMAAIADWLGSLPQFRSNSTEWRRDLAEGAITSRSLEAFPEASELILGSQHALLDCLREIEGGHRPLSSMELPIESGWTTALLADRAGSRTRDFQIQISQMEQQLEQFRSSTSWRLTRPVRWVMGNAMSNRGKRKDS